MPYTVPHTVRPRVVRIAVLDCSELFTPTGRKGGTGAAAATTAATATATTSSSSGKWKAAARRVSGISGAGEAGNPLKILQAAAHPEMGFAVMLRQARARYVMREKEREGERRR